MFDIITVVNIAAVDLNLLVVLHAVLVEKNATRAAKRLGVTQPAVSNALSRLRDVFNDPLVVRHARGLAPTPRAEALLPNLTRSLRDLGAIIDGDGHTSSTFDPKTTTREFTLACADYYGAVVLPPLIEALRKRAPNAKLRLVTLEQLVSGGGLADDVDVHVGRPPTMTAGCSSLDLFEEEFVCLTRAAQSAPKNAPKNTKRMTLREYRDAEHIRVRVLDSVRDPIDIGLEKHGIERTIALTVPHFSLAPLVVLRTGYVATLSHRLARLYAGFLPQLIIRRPPINLAPRPVRMIWHDRTNADPAARFFRDLVVGIGAA